MIRLVITEGIESTWHYHLSESDNKTRALCGKQTMPTNFPITNWGLKDKHIGQCYCKKCEELGKLLLLDKVTVNKLWCEPFLYSLRTVIGRIKKWLN